MMHSEGLAGGHLTICPLLPFFFLKIDLETFRQCTILKDVHLSEPEAQFLKNAICRM